MARHGGRHPAAADGRLDPRLATDLAQVAPQHLGQPQVLQRDRPDVAEEPVPDRFVKLLEALEAREKKL